MRNGKRVANKISSNKLFFYGVLVGTKVNKCCFQGSFIANIVKDGEKIMNFGSHVQLSERGFEKF
jgi:hypothetical protein